MSFLWRNRYRILRFERDLNAVRRRRVPRRIGRRIAGKITGRLMGRIFR
jgi:hypothetical protein